MTVRLTSWLAPSIPRALHRALAGELGRALGTPVELRFEAATSAPPEGADPFASGAADLGWMCSPGYLRLGASVELLPAPCTADARAAGRPVYFSDVVVRRDDPARAFADLAGRTWAFNDPCSLSGWLTLRQRLDRAGEVTLRASGSHLRSLAMVAGGTADAAAVDANALALALRRRPALNDRLRVLESWGPHPIQPLVAATCLASETRAAVRAALLGLAADPRAAARLARWRMLGFAAVSDADYRSEALVRLCEPGEAPWG